MAEAINESGLSFVEWMEEEYPYWEDPTEEESATVAVDATEEDEETTEAEETEAQTTEDVVAEEEPDEVIDLDA